MANVKKTTSEKKVHTKMETAPVDKKSTAAESETRKGKVKNAKKIAKTKVVGSEEVQSIRDAIKGKPDRMFRGRFGQRKIRKISKEKWQKWRYPRGMDIKFRKEDGYVPEPGFRTPNWIRYRHPSGFLETTVRTLNEMANAAKKKDTAVRIARTIGKRKKLELLQKASELGIKVLN